MVLLFFAFLVVPLVELFVIGEVAGVIGVPWTILLLVVDSLAGAWLVRREGRRAWHEFTSAVAGAQWPGDQVMAGAMVLVGGALLVTPGFVTDAVGLSLVLPPTRRLLATVLRSRVQPLQVGRVTTFGSFSQPGAAARGPGHPTRPPSDAEVIEAEVVDVQREQPPELD